MLGRHRPACGTLHSGICSPDGTADASPRPCGSGFSSSRRALLHGGWARKPGAEFQVPTRHVRCGSRSGDMAAPGPALCLFDVDGTLTAPRQVGGALRAGGGRCRVSCGPRTGPATTQGGHRGAAEDRPPPGRAQLCSGCPGGMRRKTSGHLERGMSRKTLESKKLVFGWEMQFWTLTGSPRFGPLLCPLTSCVPSSFCHLWGVPRILIRKTGSSFERAEYSLCFSS